MLDLRMVIYIFLIWNLIVTMLYFVDKRKAINNSRRISEKTLILSAFLMGGIGAFAGMFLFRHKTKHMSFLIAIPLAIIVNAAVIYGVYFY